jgi:hypothetical protein
MTIISWMEYCWIMEDGNGVDIIDDRCFHSPIIDTSVHYIGIRKPQLIGWQQDDNNRPSRQCDGRWYMVKRQRGSVVRVVGVDVVWWRWMWGWWM